MAAGTKKKTKTKKNIPKPKEIKINPKLFTAAVCICAALAVIISAVSLHNSQQRPKAEVYHFGKSAAQGVDVSEHNGKIDWTTLSKEFDFAFIRVGYRGYAKKGIIGEDKYARENLAAANKAGIPVGIYFYSQATTEREAEKEAAFALKIAKRYKLDLPIMIDFEYPCDRDGNQIGRLADANLSAEENTQIINAFLNKVTDKGYSAGIYASSSVLKNRISSRRLSEGAVIWVADYNKKVSYNVDYTIWQYSEKGKSDAVSSEYVDLNYWYQ